MSNTGAELIKQYRARQRANPTESQNHQANRQFLLGATRV
jgi:hypothetical protein